MKILITGAGGMLGQDLVRVFSDQEVTATDRDELDITDEAAVRTFIESLKPDLIMNAAAFNAVDKVEDPEAFPFAQKINGDAPGFLASAAKDVGARFVHYSTDYVFRGTKPEGYVESDMPMPISKYGETKLAGEQSVQKAGGHSYILRTSKIFGAPGISEVSKESFVALMLRLAKEKPEISIVDEEVGCPTYSKDLAVYTKMILEGDYEPGVYHAVNGGEPVTWYAFAEEVFSLKPSDTPRTPVASSEFPKPAARPKFAPLLNTKLPPMRDRQEALREFLS